jgi:prolyl-tRNA editing enzyme YbaK/EbsC (Cys-tRNA(Pro) deacylase)
MDISLGTLAFLPAQEHPELMAPVVMSALLALPDTGRVGITAIDPSLSDTAAFCEHYGTPMETAANCVILEAKREDSRRFVACVLRGSDRADINGLVRKITEARKVSFAQMEKAVERSGMAFGAITPIGLPDDWPILIDKAVADSAYVIVGSGVRASKLAVPGQLLASLPNAQVLEGLGQPRIA